MAHNKYDLSIVIPAYREAKRIGKTMDKLADFINKDKTIKKLNVELIVVSADSDDKTHEIINKRASNFKNFKFIPAGKQVGKGRDVKLGMQKAQGDVAIFMDADLATPLKYITQFYNLYLSGYDVIVATRNLKKHHPELLRRSLSIAGNILYRVIGGVWIEDSQCGFKMFSRKASRVCFSKLTTTGWGFDMEVLTIAKVNHFKIKPVRVNDWVSVPGGSFASGAIKSSLASLKDLSLIFARRLNGKYR